MARPDVLFLTHRTPYPPDKGDRIRTYHILRWLSGWANVDLCALSDETPDPRAAEELQPLCQRSALIPHPSFSRKLRGGWSFACGRTVSAGMFQSPRFARRIALWRRERSRPWNSVLLSASSLASYADIPALSGIPVVVDLVDVDSEKWRAYAEMPDTPAWRRWIYAREAVRLRRLERKLARRARAITLVSRAEAALFRQTVTASDGNVYAVTNGVDCDFFQPDMSSLSPVPRAVFVGALDYRPNIDAACWLAREVWPLVRKRLPDAVLELVGRRPTQDILHCGSFPGVVISANVPDVRVHLRQAWIALAPLRLARGVQNKVLEALAMAQPTVISHQANAGLDLVPDRDVLVADASLPVAWADAVVSLCQSPNQRLQLGASGRQFVVNRHHWATCLEPFRSLLAP